MKKLTLARYAVCLPDYWGGWAGPFICIPLSASFTGDDITEEISREYRSCGFYDNSDDDYTDQLKVIMADFFTEKGKAKVNPFGLELEEDDTDMGESVYLYLMFETVF